jgi:acyl dehydratase
MDTRCPETLELALDPITAVDLALYAAASGDLNPLHLDADVARAAGFDRPIAHGMRTMACAVGSSPALGRRRCVHSRRASSAPRSWAIRCCCARR